MDKKMLQKAGILIREAVRQETESIRAELDELSFDMDLLGAEMKAWTRGRAPLQRSEDGKRG